MTHESKPRPLIFGGARRSGTTWLTGLLNGHPEIECRNEGWLFNELGASFPTWIDRQKFDAWADGPEAQGTWLRHLSKPDAIDVMLRGAWEALVREAVVKEGWKDYAKLKWIGDKTTLYVCTQIEDVHRLFPDARFIHMLRDGRDVVVSDAFLLLRNLREGDILAEHRAEIEAMRAYFLHGQGEPIPLLSEGLATNLIGDWTRAVKGAARARELYGDRFIEVRYDRLVDNPHEEYARLLEWLGVDDASETRVNYLVDVCKFENFSGGRTRGTSDVSAEWRKGVVGDWVNHFRPEDKVLFKRLAGDLLIEAGFVPDSSW